MWLDVVASGRSLTDVFCVSSKEGRTLEGPFISTLRADDFTPEWKSLAIAAVDSFSSGMLWSMVS